MKKNGKYESGRYHTIEITKNVGITINDERVRLGIKKKNDKGVEYPFETDYFVCPKRIREIFGEEPTELTVYFPVANREIVFPQAYEKYGKNQAMQCQGDGEESAQKKDQETGEWSTVKCPCKHFEKKYDKVTKIGGCEKVGYLRFMIPTVSIGTFFQCAVHGTVSINECNSGFYTADKTTGARWAMIPFRMRRVARKIKIPGTAKMKTHWVVTLEVIAGIEEIRRVMAGELLYLGQLKEGSQYQLEAPGPQEGNPPEVKEETDEETKSRETKEAEEKKAKGEALKKEVEESRTREAQLKKDSEEGKDKLKSYKESKTIYKKRVEEENEILQAISKKAEEAGIDSFEELVNFALDQGIFKTQLTEHLATRVLVTNKDVKGRLLKALEELSKSKEEEVPKEELPKEDREKLLANLFDIAQKAGFKNWEEIIGEGCRTKISEEEYVFDIPTTLEEAKEMLINKPETLKKMKEIFSAMAKATN